MLYSFTKVFYLFIRGYLR